MTCSKNKIVVLPTKTLKFWLLAFGNFMKLNTCEISWNMLCAQFLKLIFSAISCATMITTYWRYWIFIVCLEPIMLQKVVRRMYQLLGIRDIGVHGWANTFSELMFSLPALWAWEEYLEAHLGIISLHCGLKTKIMCRNWIATAHENTCIFG